MPHTASMTRLGPSALRMQHSHLGAATPALTDGRRVITSSASQIAHRNGGIAAHI